MVGLLTMLGMNANDTYSYCCLRGAVGAYHIVIMGNFKVGDVHHGAFIHGDVSCIAP